MGGQPKGTEEGECCDLVVGSFHFMIRSPSEGEAGRKGNEAFRRVICCLEMKDYNINGMYLKLCREI